MALPQFEIEAILVRPEAKDLVFARALSDVFNIKPGSKLKGVRIAGADIPRKLDAEGNAVFDIWVFQLAEPNSAGRFHVGEVVELTPS